MDELNNVMAQEETPEVTEAIIPTIVDGVGNASTGKILGVGAVCGAVGYVLGRYVAKPLVEKVKKKYAEHRDARKTRRALRKLTAEAKKEKDTAKDKTPKKETDKKK